MTLTGILAAETVDGDVRFRFTVENTGDDARTLSFSDGQRFDVTVTDGDDEAWRFSEGQMFMQMLGSETLEAGESAVYEATWEVPAAGEYEARAELVATDADCEATTAVSV